MIDKGVVIAYGSKEEISECCQLPLSSSVEDIYLSLTNYSNKELKGGEEYDEVEE